MSSSPKKAFSFTKLLRLACAGLEILIIVGLLVMIVMVPFAESSVSSGSQVEIVKNAKSGEFTYTIHPHSHVDGTPANESSAQPAANGVVSLGPFSLSPNKEGQYFKGATTDADVSVQKIEAMVAFKGPARTKEALDASKWPAFLGELCAILIGLAFFEMLRRLLSSAEKGDLFTDSNVRMLRQAGFLMIALDLVRFAAGAILMSRLNAIVAPFFTNGMWTLSTTVSGKLTGAISGMSVLLLAEVFREGLKFRKDSDLTI
jgi:hypothetical protein